MRYKIAKSIFILSFIPFMVQVVLTVYYMIVGTPWLMNKTIYGLDVLQLSGLFFIGLWYVYVPVIVYQIGYIILKPDIKEVDRHGAIGHCQRNI